MLLRTRTAGFTLIELLIVITIMAIMAGLVVVNLATSIPDRLQGAAEILAGEIAYARSLAVTNNDKYLVTINAALNEIVLTHSGTNAVLDTLPVTAAHSPLDTASKHVVALASLPNLGSTVSVLGAESGAATPTVISTIEFGPLGETVASEASILWLTGGSGDSAAYLSISVNPVTGLTTIGALQGNRPSGL
ncbi:MAG TPA: prepilin-type N-terminal cleavage/methylation domain-containing protein [Pirellulales bacterium]|jgi:prepilin-type N-terminal cleavage/methylation domain-containing protein|nr:prepilin-type N-terminal cleavage/methylation domain-containing protein [Pirellulales bacterium]